MNFDIRAPSSLKECQQWFASIIVRPIDMQNCMNEISPTGQRIEEEACQYINPSFSLKPHKRIELYNQQYWWRLLNVMHDIFPLVVRMFGYTDFNQTIGFPYLVKYPPNHWSLNNIGESIYSWIQDEYHNSDKQFVLNAAVLDWSYNQSFVMLALPSLRLDPHKSLSSISTCMLYLQPSVFLFEYDYDLFTFRDEMTMQRPDYWIDHDFPSLNKGKKYFVLCRSTQLQIIWSEISAGEYFLLNCFKSGSTLTKACQAIEKQSNEIVNDALDNIQRWFAEWVTRDWLSLEAISTDNANNNLLSTLIEMTDQKFSYSGR